MAISSNQPPARRRLSLWIVAVLIGICCLVPKALEHWQLYQIRELLADARSDQAVVAAEKFVQKNPGSAAGRFLLAKATRRDGKLNEAAEHLRFAAEMGHNADEIRFEETLAIAQIGRISSVEGRLEVLFASKLDDASAAEVYEAVAYGHWATFNVAEFHRCVNFWISWQTDAVNAHMIRGDFYQSLSNHAEAAKDFEKAIKIRPDSWKAHAGYANALLSQNKIDAALGAFETGGQRFSDRSFEFGIAVCLHRLGRAEEAKGRLLALDTAGDAGLQSSVSETLGRIYLENQDTENALKYLKDASKLTPYQSSVWHSLATAHTLSGDGKLAAESLEKAQIIQERHVRIGDILRQLSDEPENVKLRFEVASLMFEEEMANDGVAWLNSVLRMHPNNVQAHQLLARHYAGAGMSELAQRHAEAAGGGEPQSTSPGR